MLKVCEIIITKLLLRVYKEALQSRELECGILSSVITIITVKCCNNVLFKESKLHMYNLAWKQVIVLKYCYENVGLLFQIMNN